MIGPPRFIGAFSAPAEVLADETKFQGMVRNAARAGFHLMFVRPGTKEPVCPLGSATIRKADQAAQEAAREAGHPHWDRVRHDCGMDHASDDPKFLDGYLKRMAKAGAEQPNLAIEVGASRMICIDIDTPAELAGWRQSWLGATGTPWAGELTVSSPGVFDQTTRAWKHHGGGHIWIDLSDLPPDANRDLLLSVGEGVYKDPSGWTAMYRDRYVLVPPSTREGRGYAITGIPLAGNVNWLLTLIGNAAVQRETRRMEQAERRAARLADPRTGLGEVGMIEWSTATSWHDLLAPLGWVDTGLVHSCGCPDWTMAPVEDHASPRSATAHEDGCSATGFDNDEGHQPLRIWSDNRPPFLLNVPREGARIMTKVQFAAAVARPESRHGCDLSREDIAAGLRAHGLSADGVPLVGLSAPLTEHSVPVPVTGDQVTAALTLPAPLTPAPVDTPLTCGLSQMSQMPSAPVATLGQLGVSSSAPARHPRMIQGTPSVLDQAAPMASYVRNPFSVLSTPRPEPLIPDVVDLGNLFRIYGTSGSGKTHVAVSLAVSVAAGVPWAGFDCVGQGRVLYLAPEDADGVMRRMVAGVRDLGFPDEQGVAIGAQLATHTYPSLSAGTQGWLDTVEFAREYRPALIIIDTQAQVSSQEYEENSNREMQAFVAQVAKLRDVTGAAVGLVAHTGKSKTDVGARGASAVTASMDVEYFITSDKATSPGAATITVTNTKAKGRPEWTEERSCFLVPSGESVAVSFDPTRRPAPVRAAADPEAGLMESARQRAIRDAFAGELAGMTRSQALGRLGEAGAGGHRVGPRTWRRDLDTLFDAGVLGDAHGTVYSRTTSSTGVEKVYAPSMPLHLVAVSLPPSDSVTARPHPSAGHDDPGENPMPKKNVSSTPHPQTKAQRKGNETDEEVVARLGGKNPVVDPTDVVQEPLAKFRDGVDKS